MARHAAALLLAASAAAPGAAARGRGSASQPPNVVILLVDDLGYGDIGAYGNSTIKTPHIDRLAREGVLLTQHLVASPMCTPSRAALLTGRHAIRTGMSGDKIARIMPSPAVPGGIDTRERTIASMLKARGFATAMVGKWHVGMGTNCSLCPRAHGFDSYWGMPVTNVQACGYKGEWVTQRSRLEFILSRYPAGLVARSAVGLLCVTALLCGLGRAPRSAFLLHALCTLLLIYVMQWVPSTIMLLNPKACVLFENDTVVEQPVQLKYLTHRATLRAERFVRAAAAEKRPFFLYLAYHKVHTALFSTDEFAGVSAHGEYGDNVEEMDDSVGRVLAALDKAGVAESTLVYFSSDNGPWKEQASEGGACGSAPADPAHPLRGGKAQTWECGIRVPGIVRWKGRLKPRVEHAATTNMDLLPTIAAAVGAPVPPHVADTGYAPAPAGEAIDGRDLLPLLSGAAPAPPHDVIFHYCDQLIAAVRVGRYKVHFATTKWSDVEREACPDEIICPCAAVPHEPPLVFDIEADPAERVPLHLAADEGARAAAAAAVAAREKQRASVVPVRTQTELAPVLDNFPCCGYPHPGLARTLAIITDSCGC